MLFCNTLLCDAAHVDRLPSPQLHDAAPCALWIDNDRPPNLVVWSVALNDQVPRIHLHDLTACAFCVQRENDGAVVAVALAVAIARVQQVFDASRRKRNQAEAVAHELVGEHGGVVEDFHDVDGEGGDLGQHHSPHRVGGLEVEVLHDELGALVVRLHKVMSAPRLPRHWQSGRCTCKKRTFIAPPSVS
jgi:hypothetical protein